MPQPNKSRFISEPRGIYKLHVTRPRAEKVCEHGLFGAADNVEQKKLKMN